MTVAKVSVVVPVYNPGRYLKPCVESLLQQTLPPGELEVVFVDDGSTDESPAYLDEVALAHDHIRVIHQENSGWPGQPRNVGIAATTGEYLFFCDHDDWFERDALERLYDFAAANDSDVVLPKMGGRDRPVPHHVFNRTRTSVSLADSPIMDSLTPHKLFRRAFLDRHQIHFPEGRRRLEDHLFVVTAYLLADRIGIYADSTCYVHIAREDASNAGFRKINWEGYFDNLSEAVEVVVQHTEPGPLRDRIFRRWLQVEMVKRLSGRRLVKMDPAEAAELFTHASRVAGRYFGPGVVQLVPPLARPVAAAIIRGDQAEVHRLAVAQARWTVQARLLQAGWSGRTLQISGTVVLTDTVPLPETPLDPVELSEHASSADGGPEARFAALFGDLSPAELEAGYSDAKLVLDITERDSGARWPVTARLHRTGLTAAFTADLDPESLAGGKPLPRGYWDVFVQFGILGLNQRRRLTLTGERRPGAPSVPTDGGAPTTAAYFTENAAGLTLDVGLRKQKQLRRPDPQASGTPASGPAGKTAPVPGSPSAATPAAARPSVLRRGARKLRRTWSQG
jgi:glycosyltransferase involved in cell wall biosynthesis